LTFEGVNKEREEVDKVIDCIDDFSIASEKLINFYDKKLKLYQTLLLALLN
jgi:hypothetical protein